MGDYEKYVMTAAPIVFAILATLAYLLRLYARRISAVALWYDDLLMGIGLCISYGATVSVIFSEL
jgi:hypothetical protein